MSFVSECISPVKITDENNIALGNRLASDLALQTTLLVCAICSELKTATQLMSLVLRKDEVPELDECGIVNSSPCRNADFYQLFACDVCYCNGKVLMKHAQWNVHGFGKLELDVKDCWLSEESFISTVTSAIAVKHCGSGGYSFKQESLGSASFYYHSVLDSMYGLLQECENEEKMAVGWVREGQSVRSGALMMIRITVVLKLFQTFWTNNSTYRVQCLQCANGFWSTEKVEQQLLPLIEKRLCAATAAAKTNDESSNQQHHWPWKVLDKNAKRHYVKVGAHVTLEGVSEICMFVQAFPCMFPKMDHEKSLQLSSEMSLRRFAQHLALLSDNRLGKHDRALFVLNYILLKKKICSEMFSGRAELPSFLEEVGDLRKLEAELKKSIEEEEEKEKEDNVKEKEEKSYQSDSLVYALLSGMKMYAKNVSGHPMARASYRRTLKCLHRSLNPGSVWLTININDKGNQWLKKMYGCDKNEEPDYETVKSGGIAQAVFFDAYVKSFIDNVLTTGLFCKIDWAGGTIEWCQDGTSHLHLIAALERVSPQNMAEHLKDGETLKKLEEWIGTLFCENNNHSDFVDGALLRVMQDKGQLLHMHSALCSKYQKKNSDGKCKCRFEYGRQLCDCENGAKFIVNQETRSWKWKIERDHKMALCHCDALYEIHHACGGVPNFHHFCQFFGGSGADGQRVIMYATNYTTKMGMTRIEMKKMLREVVQLAIGKLVKVGPENWSCKDRVLWIIQSALLKMLQAVSIPQAQAALNVLGLKEFHCTKPDETVVTLFSPPFVDYVKNEGKFKPESSVIDYMYRGMELENHSLWLFAFEGWQKVKKENDLEHVDDENHVSFLRKHPDYKSHWLERKRKNKQRQNSRDIDVIVNVIRRKQFVVNDKLREIWLLSIATHWRTYADIASRNWKEYSEDNSEEIALIEMSKLLVNEMSLIYAKEDLDENRSIDDVDYVNEGNSRKNKHHMILEHRDSNDDEKLISIIGGENGANAVMAGRIAGLIPVPSQSMRHEDELEKNVGLRLSYDQFRAMTNNAEKEAKQIDKEDEETELIGLAKKEMSEILEDWLQQSTVLGRCNPEHKVAILTCVLYLADEFCEPCEKMASDFSMVIQGSGGTGKTQSVICAVKEFVDVVCSKTDNNIWKKCVLLLGPTNMVAKAMGGSTIDCGLLNRRSPQSGVKCSKLVKLVIVDEFSMVSLQWVDQISRALQEAKGQKEKPFGGVSVVWIGDVHQLPPIMGQSVYTPINMVKNAKDYCGRLLWTGEKWSERQSLSVLMKHQYRMQEPLASISERFANGDQTVSDAMLLSEKVLEEGVEDWELHFRNDPVSTRVLCSENNSKAALNWEIVKWLHQNEWNSWEAQNDINASKNLEVVDQLEPMQCAWKWMPVICLENYLGTDVVNGALCWILHIVLKEDESMPHSVLVVAAETQDMAKAKINGKTLSKLILDKVVVPIIAVKREGRKAIPLAPVWCMTLHKVQGATLDRVVLNLSGGLLSASLLYTAITRVHEFDKLWLLQKLSPSLLLTMKFSPHVKAEIQRLKLQENKTRDHLLDRVKKWSNIPALLDMKWMNDFGKEEIEENVMNNDIQAEEDYNIKKNHAICCPVKSSEIMEENSNWVSACTMFCCPAILLLKAKEVGAEQFLEFNFDTDDWSPCQLNQVQRAAIIVNLRTAMKEMEVGALLEKEWLYIEKREKENEWKKLFKGKDNTCMKILKQAVRKREREEES